jgi:hypothetical protein
LRAIQSEPAAILAAIAVVFIMSPASPRFLASERESSKHRWFFFDVGTSEGQSDGERYPAESS